MHDEPTRRETDRQGAWKTAALLGLMVARSARVRRASTALFDRKRNLIILPFGLDDDDEEAAILGVIQQFGVHSRPEHSQRPQFTQSQN